MSFQIESHPSVRLRMLIAVCVIIFGGGLALWTIQQFWVLARFRGNSSQGSYAVVVYRSSTGVNASFTYDWSNRGGVSTLGDYVPGLEPRFQRGAEGITVHYGTQRAKFAW